MRRSTTVLIGAAVLLGMLGVGRELSRSRTYQIFGEIIPRVTTSERVLALTFDDGPTSQAVSELLPMLRSRGVKATFFVVGRQLEKTPELGRKIVDEGHELGNHSYSHRRMIFKSLSFIEEEIQRTDRLIRDAGFEGNIQFRPPYGKKLVALPYYLSTQGRPAVTWDVEAEADPAIAGHADKIAAYVVSRAQSGSIILLHPMYRSGKASLDAVEQIIDGLQRQGYRFVTVSELINARDGG